MSCKGQTLLPAAVTLGVSDGRTQVCLAFTAGAGPTPTPRRSHREASEKIQKLLPAPYRGIQEEKHEAVLCLKTAALRENYSYFSI